MEQDKKPPHFELTGSILNCCFEVMKELGLGFLGNIYKNALVIAMRQQTVIVELKCCESLGREHQAQLFNYLKVSQLPIGLLVNFRRGKLEWKRLQSNQEFIVDMETLEEAVPL